MDILLLIEKWDNLKILLGHENPYVVNHHFLRENGGSIGIAGPISAHGYIKNKELW
jgi:hypothetical protein